MTEFSINIEKLEELMKSKGHSVSTLSKATGITPSVIYKYLAGKGKPSVASLNSLCMVLDIKPEDLKVVERTKSSPTAKVFEDAQTEKRVDALASQITQLEDDLAKIASVLLDIQKTVKEAKAQAELNHDDISAVFNKTTEVNSAISKIYASSKRHY